MADPTPQTIMPPMEERNRIKIAQYAAGYRGFWCWDCDAPAPSEGTYLSAIEGSKRAGWRIIRGVDRCAACSAADDVKEKTSTSQIKKALPGS